LRKRFYIMLVARNAEGELLKIPIPLHYAYVFIAGALIGMLTITGMAGSYTRMVLKTQKFNQLRTEKAALNEQYKQLEQIAQENQLQAQSLTSLAGEVSSLYGLKPDPAFQDDDPASASLQQFYALRMTAMTGAASVGIGMGDMREASTRDWLRLAAAPTLWPVQGRVTGSFGERIDPFSGEGAFHRGIDIASEIGTRIALGATSGSVLRLILRQGLGLISIGLVIGIAAAFAVTRFLTALLFGVRPADPLNFLAVAVLLLGTGLAASYFPARRAAKVDPMAALRCE